ncbi:MAG: hypothetical protein A3D64_02500 [Candidatus Wildermuthbacteria bacterium RIFCSPHIGHO2_02_FULL_49_9]|uniref:Addiction module toxin RelE n=3 Tax=Parcubacteria group TaxID=1794811 RepID=A0A1F8DQQ3_9BACT|nr:MAG: hypothetical protein A2755_03050 [Candidatus Wolfebacteria bacterium RIFCSPHIGHO2_01_FULL_48_22]OGM92568.1 MAG: hypothetical protein A2935_01425 [Candidatus Wolfebacteria bacterium RIFCSPLOWO2_01_FULL_47_17b]OHA70121.1 MAG: hypothetical protein A3D64_02500 [Candidatus Wildermuthbacteria bacterium RIFCSPHIGHO2_02_FULL_49_9]
MESWKFDITDQGRTDINHLDTKTRRRVLEKLKWFTESFGSLVSIPLGGAWRGFFKLRVGSWRIVYDVDYSEHIITVHAVDRRDRVYKKRR